MIRLSCADNTFRLVQPWENAVELIRLLEIEAVDVCLMGNRSHIRPEDIRGDLHALAPGSAKASDVADSPSPTSSAFPGQSFERFAPNHPDPDERSRSRALFVDVLELTERIEAPGVTMAGIDWDGESHTDSFDRAVAELSWRAQLARGRGVRFSVEAHLPGRSSRRRPRRAPVRDGRGRRAHARLQPRRLSGYSEDDVSPFVPHARPST